MQPQTPFIHKGYRRKLMASQVFERHRTKSQDLKKQVGGLIDKIRLADASGLAAMRRQVDESSEWGEAPATEALESIEATPLGPLAQTQSEISLPALARGKQRHAQRPSTVDHPIGLRPLQ